MPAPQKSTKSSPVPDAILVLDLGAAHCRASLVVDGRPEVIEWVSMGGALSTVVGHDGPSLTLGDAARRLALTEPRTNVLAPNRLAGVRFEHAGLDRPDAQGQARWREVPVVRGPGGDVHFDLGGEHWPIPRLMATLIQTMIVELARTRTIEIERTVVGVPAGASDSYRRALAHALTIADLPAVELVNSTTAAALAWLTLEREGQAAVGLAKLEAALSASLGGEGAQDLSAGLESEAEESAESDAEQAGEAEVDESAESEAEGDTESEPGQAGEPEVGQDVEAEAGWGAESEPGATADLESEGAPTEQRVLVLDLGAGCFSAALVCLDSEGVEVLAARSLTDLGGQDIDERLVEWMLEQFEAETELDLSGEPTVRSRMRDVAEKAKRGLSDEDSYELRLPYLWADASGPKHLAVALDRERFERMIADITERVARLAAEVVADGGRDAEDLDAVVMVGGTSRIPVIQDRLEAAFGRVPETELTNPALDEDFVVRGLALEAHRRVRRRGRAPGLSMVEVASHDLWLRPLGHASEAHHGEPVDLEGEVHRVIERGTTLPARGSFGVSVDMEGGWTGFELLEGDADDRWPVARLSVSGRRPVVDLHIELGLDGRARGRVDELVRGKVAQLRQYRRVGLSERAVLRLREHARARMNEAAQRDLEDAQRGAVQELVRSVETWLGDAKSGVDELLGTSLKQWAKEAETALEHGAQAHFEGAIEAFEGLLPALPESLAEAVSARLEGLDRGEVDEDDEPVDGEDGGQALGEVEDDYGEDDLVPLIREDEDEDGDEGDISVAGGEAEGLGGAAENAETDFEADVSAGLTRSGLEAGSEDPGSGSEVGDLESGIETVLERPGSEENPEEGGSEDPRSGSELEDPGSDLEHLGSKEDPEEGGSEDPRSGLDEDLESGIEAVLEDPGSGLEDPGSGSEGPEEDPGSGSEADFGSKEDPGSGSDDPVLEDLGSGSGAPEEDPGSGLGSAVEGPGSGLEGPWSGPGGSLEDPGSGSAGVAEFAQEPPGDLEEAAASQQGLFGEAEDPPSPHEPDPSS